MRLLNLHIQIALLGPFVFNFSVKLFNCISTPQKKVVHHGVRSARGSHRSTIQWLLIVKRGSPWRWPQLKPKFILESSSEGGLMLRELIWPSISDSVFLQMIFCELAASQESLEVFAAKFKFIVVWAAISLSFSTPIWEEQLMILEIISGGAWSILPAKSGRGLGSTRIWSALAILTCQVGVCLKMQFFVALMLLKGQLRQTLVDHVYCLTPEVFSA